MSCRRFLSLHLLPNGLTARVENAIVLMTLALSCVIAGCGSTPTRDGTPTRDADASLTSLVSNPEDTLELPDPRSTLTEAEKERWARQAALDLEQVFSSAAQQSNASPPTSEPASITRASDARNGATTSSDERTLGSAAATADATATPVPPALESDAGNATDGANSPTAANTGLSALAADTPANGTNGSQSAQGATPQASTTTQQLTIVRSALCSKVEGFGRFKPMASNVFAAGRPIRVIVYTEIDGFASRPARSGDPVQAALPIEEQSTVELSQALKLFADADGVVAWQKPAQRAIETTATRRKDFFLVQVVELPSTLTIGRYNLKINLTDSTSRMQAESVLSIVIVADPSASRVTR